MNTIHAEHASIAVGQPWSRTFAPRAAASARRDADVAPRDAVEVKVFWAGELVRIAHVSEGASFTIGEAGCDFALPADSVGGAARVPLAFGRAGRLFVTVPRGWSGAASLGGGAVGDVQAIIASGEALPSRRAPGAHEIELGAGSSIRLTYGPSNVVFELGVVESYERPSLGLAAAVSSEAHPYTGMSALMHGLLLASLAFFLPGMAGTDGETIDRDQVDAMRPYLASIAEREHDAREEDAVTEAKQDKGGGTGTAAMGESGSMGSRTAAVKPDARYGVKGSADNTDPHIARERAKLEAETFGLVGILQGDTENAPVAPWGRPEASGKDAKSALGLMWGSSIDDAFGAGGLGLTSIGEGGGGRGEGIGLGHIGTIGNGDGTGTGQGFGPGDGSGHGSGLLPATHVPKGIRMRVGDTHVDGGRIPPEVIQRIVRQNFGRFRVCYEDALRNNPGLSGRVAVKFVIDRHGSVSLASDGGSDLPDQGVVSCVVRGFQNLSFPEPTGGSVRVTYPLMFTPGE